MTDSEFTIYHTNIRSCVQNFKYLLSYLNSLSFRYDIIILTETWLTDDFNDLFNIPGYNEVSLHRNRNGGGIRVYYYQTITADVCEQFTGIFSTHESLFLKISLKHKLSLIVGCFYRPPSKSVFNFIEYLNELVFVNQTLLKEKCVLIGDFNIDLLQLDNRNSHRVFTDSMTENGFRLLIDQPTHLNAQANNKLNSLIDHVWVNFAGEMTSGVLDHPLSDHLPIYLHIKLSHARPILKKIQFRCFTTDGWDKLENDKTRLFNSYRIETCNVDREVSKFDAWLQNIVNNYFPIKTKTISTKRVKMPWLDKETLKLISKKHKLFLAYKRKLVTYQYFNAYCKILKILINRLEVLYYKRKFEIYSKDSKKMWQIINKLSGRQTKNVQRVKTNEGEIVTEPKEVANIFNTYFNNIPEITQNSLESSLCNYDHLVPFCDRSMFLIPATEYEITKTISGLKAKSNTLKMPLKFIKNVKDEISVIICELFNLSISEAVYPDLFKIARIVPVAKKGNSICASNFRPIAILSLFNKIFEKLLYTRLNSFFTTHKLISKNQFGFRAGHDTQQATLKLLYHILPCLGSNIRSASVFLDFTKAFDTITHDLLLKKLERYGVRGEPLRLIRSYLTSRMHYVRVDDQESNLLPSRVGVPQGSCLGPLFFIIYINDLNILLDGLETIMYADDTTLIQQDQSPAQLALKLNFVLYKVLDWCHYNKLALNTAKTKWMYFSTKKDVIPDLYLNGSLIERVSVFKYLGYNIDERLTHSTHVKLISTKLSRFKHITKQIRKYLSPQAARTYYYGFIYSAISYGLLVWAGSLSNALGTRLCRLHDKIIFNLFSKDYETMGVVNNIYKRNKILKLDDLYKLKSCHTLYKIMHEGYSPFLFETITSLINSSRYNTRHSNNLRLPFPSVRSVKLNFIYRAISYWNDLDPGIKSLPSSSEFLTSVTESILFTYAE